MLDASVGRTISRVAEAFQKLEIPFHVTGGIVSSYYGVPRYTMDIDFVVLLEQGHRDLPAIVEVLNSAFEIDLESAGESLRSHGIFQALDKESFHKVDFHSGQRIPGEFSRSTTREIYTGVSVPIASPEDCVISKLVWASMGSGTSWKDAVQVMQVQTQLDHRLLRQLANQLELAGDLDRLIAEASN